MWQAEKILPTLELGLTIILLVGTASCENKEAKTGGSSDPLTQGSPRGDGPSGGGPYSSACTELGTPSPPIGNAQLLFHIKPGIDPCTISGYLVGNQSRLKVKRSLGFRFFIENIPSGTYDLILLSSADRGGPAAMNLTPEKSRGVRINKIRALNGVAETIEESIAIPISGSISGKVTLLGQVDSSGIDVFIPGTDYIGKTDRDGRYLIQNVPAGDHNLQFEKDGYGRGVLPKATVRSGEDTELEDLKMVVSTGSEGSFIIGDGSGVASSRTVKLSFGSNGDSVLMKVSENELFEGARWEPFSSIQTYTFTTPGQKTLYAKFANANGLESSVFRASVNIDLFLDRGTVARVSSLQYVPSRTIAFSYTRPKNAEKIEISEVQSFSAATPFSLSSATGAFDFVTSSDGNKTIYARFLDKDGFSSQVESFSVHVDTTPPSVPVIAPFSHPASSDPVDTDEFLATVTSTDIGGSGIDQVCSLVDQNPNLDPASISNDRCQAVQSTGANSVGAYVRKAIPPQDGTYYFHTIAVDRAGNHSSVNTYQFRSFKSFTTVGKLALGQAWSDLSRLVNVATDPQGNKIVAGNIFGQVNLNIFGGQDVATPSAASNAFLVKIRADGSHGWSKTFGGSAISFSDVKTKSNGDVVAIGSWRYPVDFDPTSGTDMPFSRTSNGVQFDDSPFILTIKSDGSYGGVMAITCYRASFSKLEIDAADNIFVLGTYNTGGDCDVDPTPSVLTKYSNGNSHKKFLIKINSNNNFDFIKEFGDYSYTLQPGIDGVTAITPQGELYLVERVRWYARAYPTVMGSVVISPTYLANANTSEELAIIKFSNDGNILWVKQTQSIANAGVVSSGIGLSDTSVDLAGNLLVAAHVKSTGVDIGLGTSSVVLNQNAGILLKIDSSGNYINHFNMPSGAEVTRLMVAPSNDIYIAGHFRDSVDFQLGGTSEVLGVNPSADNDKDFFAARLGSDFSKRWVKRWGLGGSDDSTAKPILNLDGSVWFVVGHQVNSFYNYSRVSDVIFLGVP